MFKTQSLKPLEFIRKYRRNYVNFYNLWRKVGRVPEGVTLRTLAEHPIRQSDLPATLVALLKRYRKEHPKENIRFLKYMRLVDGYPRLVVESEDDSPDEDALLTLSHTVTLNTMDEASVITDLVVATKNRDAGRVQIRRRDEDGRRH
jgi:hypothetical protein